MLVSAVQQRETAESIYVYIPSLLGLPPFPTPPRPCHHSAPSWAPCAVSSSPLALFHTWWCMYVSAALCLSQLRLLPPLCSAQLSTSASLFLPANLVSFIPIFSIPYMCVNTQYLFFSFWLGFTLYDKLYIHPHRYKWPNFVPFMAE